MQRQVQPDPSPVNCIDDPEVPTVRAGKEKLPQNNPCLGFVDKGATLDSPATLVVLMMLVGGAVMTNNISPGIVAALRIVGGIPAASSLSCAG